MPTERFKHSGSALSPANSAESYDRSGRVGIRGKNAEYFSAVSVGVGSWVDGSGRTTPLCQHGDQGADLLHPVLKKGFFTCVLPVIAGWGRVGEGEAGWIQGTYCPGSLAELTNSRFTAKKLCLR